MSKGQQVRIPHHPVYGRLGGKVGEVAVTSAGPLGRIAVVHVGDAVISVWVGECWQCSWLTGTRLATEVGDDGHAYCMECGPTSGQPLRAYTPAADREGNA